MHGILLLLEKSDELRLFFENGENNRLLKSGSMSQLKADKIE
jgi:hypothetical protein